MNEYDDFDNKYQPSNDPVSTFQPELDLDNEEFNYEYDKYVIISTFILFIVSK